MPISMSLESKLAIQSLDSSPQGSHGVASNSVRARGPVAEWGAGSGPLLMYF